MTDIPNPWLPESVAPLPADQLAVASTGATADLSFQSSDGGVEGHAKENPVKGSYVARGATAAGIEPGPSGANPQSSLTERRPQEAPARVPNQRAGAGDDLQSSAGGGESRPALGCERLTDQRLEAGLATGPAEAFPSSPAPPRALCPPGESEPPVTMAYGAGEAFRVPPGYVLIPQPNFDRMMELIVELQAEREADRIDHADYERLREKERIELLTPPPSFLKRPDFSRAMERDAA